MIVSAIQRRTLGTLSSGQVFSGVAVAGSIPAGSLIAASVSGSEAAAGLAQTSGVLGAAVIALPLARIALSRGRRAALSLGYGLGALGAIVVIMGAVSRSLPVILIGCFLVGIASASGYQARYAATDLAEADHRARSLSYVVWAGTIGAVLGPNLLNASGVLGMSLGLPQLAGPYVVAAICLAIAALVLFVFLRPDPYLESLRLRTQREGASPVRPRLRDGIEHLRARPRAVLGIAIISIGHVVMVMVMVMTPVHMSHVDVSLQLIGLVISVHVAGMYALSPVVGWAVDRWGRMPAAYAGMAILGLSCVVAGMAPADSVLQLGIGLFLLGLG